MPSIDPIPPLGLDERLPSLDYAVWGVACCVFVAALHAAQVVVVPVVGAAVLALIVTPVARYLTRRLRVPGALAALSAYVIAVVAVLSLLLVAVPTVQRLMENLPALAYRVEYKLRSLAMSMAFLKRWSNTVDELTSLGQPGEAGQVVVKEGGGAVAQLISATPVVAAQIVLMLVLAFFFIRDRRMLQRLVIGLAPTGSTRRRAARACRLVQRNAASYLLSVSMINALLGLATAVAFYVVGMPEPIAWGAAMAVLNFVPFVGPLILEVLAFLAGLAVFPSFEAALVPPALLLALNLVESNVGLPLVMEQRFMMSPLATLIAIAGGVWLWGTPGAILAVPIVVIASTGVRAWHRRSCPDERGRPSPAAPS